MNRRKFIAGAAAGVGAAYIADRAMGGVLDVPGPKAKWKLRTR